MGSFRLGSVLGFEIRIDYSWFIIFLLIFWTFSFASFPFNFPGFSSGVYIAMGLVSTLLFFVSLLAHELSHSLVARGRGIEIEGITLFIFGGVSKTRGEARTAGDEFWIAIVGPVTSLVIGVILWIVGALGLRNGWSVPVAGSALYLGILNVALGVFNLVPGFPLDGGRVLRSIIWKVTGDMTRATYYASLVGQIIGYALIVLGVIEAFAVNLIGGIWLAVIGWFLRNAASMSYRQHLLQGVLEHVRAEEAMTPNPTTVAPDLTLKEVMDDHFLRERYHAYPVVQDEHPVGLITLEQVRQVPSDQWSARHVGDIMAPAPDGLTVAPDEPMTRVLEKMESSGMERVLVTREDHLEGIITVADLTVWLRRAQERQLRRRPPWWLRGGAGGVGADSRVGPDRRAGSRGPEPDTRRGDGDGVERRVRGADRRRGGDEGPRAGDRP
jgi:Zn-dependent protease/predicted transcriptional regulator